MNTTIALQLHKVRNVGPIFRKELRSYFNSPIAYVVLVVFLALVEYLWVTDVFLMNMATLRGMFEVIPTIFLFIIPAITMRLLSEEMKSGTIELLTTRPLYDVEIVLGKFFAAWALAALALVPTLVYYITIAALGPLDHGPVIGGYIGLLLMAGVYVAVGLFASSLTENQVIAFIIGFLMMLALVMLKKALLYVPESFASVIDYIGIDEHFSSIQRGVIDSRDIIYFFSLIGFSLYCTVVSLERRKW